MTALDGAATEHANWVIKRIKAIRAKAQAAEQQAAGSGATMSALADNATKGDETAYATALNLEGPACGFSVQLHDMKEHSQESPSSLMGTVNIEPVTRTLWWEERSPDGGSVWVSEQL